MTWYWSELCLPLGLKDVMWQKQTSLCSLFNFYLQWSMFLERPPVVTLFPSVTVWKLLKCIWKMICLVCTVRLSNVLCKCPLKYTSIWANDTSLPGIDCRVHASEAQGWICGSWLTFTTLGSWAPMSNPSIDQERNETMNLTSLFLSAHCKWSSQT